MLDTSAPLAIVIVVRNALLPLQATLDSVFALAYPHVRVIVIDGASTDGSREYLNSQSDRLHFMVSEPDHGIYDAMNKGWHAAPEDCFVMYLGAGDLVLSLPSASETELAARDRVGVVLGECMVGDVAFRSRWTSEMYLRNIAHHQALMVRKAIHPASPFDVNLRIYGDWEFNLRLFKAGVGVRFLGSLQTYADPNGVSARHALREITHVARKHGGPLVGLLSFCLNWASRLRRQWSLRHAN
jgi:glycosyltransferase involved in cell wall biosynthesis